MDVGKTANSDISWHRWWMLFQMCIVAFIIPGCAYAIMPVLFQEIAQPKDVGLGLTLVQLGAIWAMLPLALGLFSIPMGIAADRYGVRLLIGLSAIIAGVFGACRGMSGGFVSLLTWMFLFGAGYAAISTNIPKFVGTWFKSKELGMANGIVLSAYSLGAGLAIQFGGSFLSPAVGGWRNILYIVGLLSLAAGVLWFINVKSPKIDVSGAGATHGRTGSGSQQNLFHGFAVTLRIRDMWFLVICQMLFLAGNMGALGYLPMYLVGKGISKATAYGNVSLTMYFFVLGAILVPMISDRLGTRKYVYFVTVGITGLSLMSVPFATGPALSAAFIVYGFFSGGYIIPRVVPVEHPRIGLALTGVAFGMITCVGFLGGFISPIVGNAYAAKAGGDSAIILWSILVLLAAFLFLFVTETHPKRAAKLD